jgi:hypothetical protein
VGDPFYFAACVSVAPCHTILVQMAAAGKTNGKLKFGNHKRGQEIVLTSDRY